MYAYSKFRRENANFKINTKEDSEGDPIYVADPSTGSDEPITGLLQILPKGLDCYDFLGVCWEKEYVFGSIVAGTGFSIIGALQLFHAGSQVAQNVTTPVDIITIVQNGDNLIYIPSNGYFVDPDFDLSSLAPEGEGESSNSSDTPVHVEHNE